MQMQTHYSDQSNEAIPCPDDARNFSIDISDVRTVKISNISSTVTSKDVRDFLSYAGDIQYVEMRRESETTQLAFVTFRNSQGADTALLFSGGVLGNQPVSITPVEDYQLPPEAFAACEDQMAPLPDSAVKKAEDVVSTMLAKGYILGKDVLKRAKSLDERIHLSSNASAIDRKIGLLEMLSMGTSTVNGKVKEMDDWLQISGKAKSAISAVGNAGSAIMSNRFVSAGASFVSGAYTAVSKAAGDVGSLTKEKVGKAQEEKWGRYFFKGSQSSKLPKTHQDLSPGGGGGDHV